MRPRRSHQIDISGVAGTRWPLVPLPEDLRQRAPAAMLAEFADLNQAWVSEDGSTSPLAAGMTDAETHIEGEWPDTRVVATFAHPHLPTGRLRRATPVFDEAGRVRCEPFASIALKETIETLDLPPASRARNGVLDV